jgi:tetratricopeptide (TPR) repeat protein
MNHIGLFLRKIHFNKLSGQLFFKRDSVQKQLHFREGELVHAKTNVTEERLGEIMFKLGKISSEAHSQMERYITPDQAIGKTLSQKGLTSQRSVDDGLAYQIKEIALSLFPHFDGEIVFQEKPAVEGQDMVTRINVPFLIEDGVRRMGFHPELQRHLEKKSPYLKNKTFLSLLTEEEKEMLDKIKGGKESDALLRSLKFNPEFFWISLYLFYCLNLIDFRDKDQIRTEEDREKDSEVDQAHSQEQLEEILAFKEKLSTSNYYQILGLAKDASDEDIKKAYFLLARKFHPDRFPRTLSPQYRVLVEDVFDNITKAYRTLTSEDLRRSYDLKAPVAAARAGESGRDVLKKADHKFRQAKTLYSQGRYEDSIVVLEEVTRMNRTKGAYFLLLALSEVKIPSMRRKAETDFQKAIELEPWNPECYVGLGMLYRQEGMTMKATKLFQKALEYDDDHEIALKEMDALKGGEKKTGLKGFFSKSFFGTKKK